MLYYREQTGVIFTRKVDKVRLIDFSARGIMNMNEKVTRAHVSYQIIIDKAHFQ